MLRYALWPAVATVVIGIVVASVLYGAHGGVSALIGGSSRSRRRWPRGG